MDWIVLTMGKRTPFIEEVASTFTQYTEIETKKFPDGEFFARIPRNIRNKSCYLVVQMMPENVFDVLITIDTLKRAHASKVTLVTPYLPYSRQDRRVDTRTPISAKVLANSLEAAGCDHIITMDVHALQIEGFYNIPFDNLQGATTLISEIIKENNLTDYMFVAPDAGAAKRTRFLADLYGARTLLLDKKRISDTQVESYIVGEITSPNCIIIDDMTSTGGTIMEAARLLKANNVKQVFAGVSHVISAYNGSGRNNILNMLQYLDGFYHLDTTPEVTSKCNPKHYPISCFKIIWDAVIADIEGNSVSSMFNQKGK